MIVCCVDFEATGLDLVNDRVIEVGAVLYSTGQRKCIESQGFLVKADKPIDANITKLTGIHQAAVDKFGLSSEAALEIVCDMAAQAEAFIGHNVLRFDKPMFENWISRTRWEDFKNRPKMWIDTMCDLPGVDGRKLSHMAADLGFLNLFPHSALADCQTVLKMIELFDFDQIVERAKSPLIVIRGEQDRSDNDLAKKRKFGWKPRWEMWLKVIKHCDLDAEVAAAPFNISLAPKEILVDQVWES